MWTFLVKVRVERSVAGCIRVLEYSRPKSLERAIMQYLYLCNDKNYKFQNYSFQTNPLLFMGKSGTLFWVTV